MDAFDGLKLTTRDGITNLAAGGTGTFAMAGLNACWAARIQARDARDIIAVALNFSAVSLPGTVQVRIETDASGKASGTLYDANASVNITPAAGWVLGTFAVAPTTGLTPGSFYHVVAITTVAGTTQTLLSNVNPTDYPTVVMTATDGSTRTNLAEITGSVPIVALKLSDNSLTSYGGLGYAARTNYAVYGTRALGATFTVPANQTWKVAGFTVDAFSRAGTPASLQAAIYSGSAIAASGAATVTIGSGYLSTANGRAIRALLPAPVSLPAGTYRAVLQDPAHTTTAANNYGLYGCTPYDPSLVPANLTLGGTSNVTATPVVWDLDNAGQTVAMSLILDDLTAPAGSGGGIVYG